MFYKIGMVKECFTHVQVVSKKCRCLICACTATTDFRSTYRTWYLLLQIRKYIPAHAVTLLTVLILSSLGLIFTLIVMTPFLEM